MVDQLDTQTLDQLVEGYPRMIKCSGLAADCRELDSMHALMDSEHAGASSVLFEWKCN